MTELRTLYDLFRAVGMKLTGRPVVLRFQHPASRKAAGTLTRLKNGAALIDISPNLTDERQLYCFLHECAHVKLHWHELGRVDQVTALARMPYSKSSKPGQPRREKEADELARTWLKTSETSSAFRGSYLEARLWALMKWRQK